MDENNAQPPVSPEGPVGSSEPEDPDEANSDVASPGDLGPNARNIQQGAGSMGAGIAIGIGFGSLIGGITDNIAMGMSLGIALGVVAGFVLNLLLRRRG